MTTIVSQCYWCKHHIEGDRCKAFGDKKIPHDIYFNIHDHTQPYEGDNGIQFEPKEKGKIPILHNPNDPWPTSK